MLPQLKNESYGIGYSITLTLPAFLEKYFETPSESSLLKMGRKNRSERSKCTSRVIWTTKQFNLFIDICLQGTAIGKRSGGGWGENGWSWLQNEMETAGLQFTKTQLKHKWDWMQQQWKSWKELIGKETGLEWDPIKGTIVASDEWWNQKVKENSNVGKLREKGIGQELFSKYETLFMDTKATGKYAYAPSCGVLLTNTNETKFNNVVCVEGSGDSEEDFEDSLNKLMQSETVLGTSSIQVASRTVVSEEVGGDVTQGSGKKQKRIDVCSSQPKQNKKVSKEKRQPIGAGLLSEQVRELKKSMDNRTSTLRATFGDKPGCSIKEIMEDVLSLPNTEEGSEFHLFCTLLLEHKSKREMYVTLKNAESKWKWLQYHYGLWTRGLWKPDMDVMHRIIIDEEDEEWESTICVVGAIICRYYSAYMHEEPCMNMDSFQTGNMWLLEILRGHEKRCVNIFRMDKNTLISLCGDLQRNYGLEASGRMTVLEKVGMFLYILALGASNRKVQERFQHSGETVSRNFHDVLKAMLCFSFDLIKPQDPTFSTIPPEILNDERYMPYFKDCIGAIDGTHVPACVKEEDLVRFVGRYGIPTQNIMAACSFDMQFTFVLAGWEGTTHDEQLFQHAIREKVINFPMPPSGKYYLVNAGYSQIEGYLGPYKGTRYHLSDFQHGSQPRGHKEIFNRWHSSLRSCMERTFGVWKVRWKILQRMNPYPFEVQRDIVIASMALHNYIRRKALADSAFMRFDQNPDFVPHDAFQNVKDYEQNESHQDNGAAQMNELRDEIAFSLMRARTQY